MNHYQISKTKEAKGGFRMSRETISVTANTPEEAIAACGARLVVAKPDLDQDGLREWMGEDPNDPQVTYELIMNADGECIIFA